MKRNIQVTNFSDVTNSRPRTFVIPQRGVWQAVACLVLLVGCLGHVLAATYVGGTISGTWTTAGSPYIATNHCYVAILTIQAGVEVDFDGNYVFQVDGRLTALGTVGSLVVFKRATNNTTGWKGIKFQDALPGSQLVYCQIDGAVAGGLTAINTVPLVQSCIFLNNTSSGDGGAISLTLPPVGSSLENCIFANNSASGRGGAISASFSGDFSLVSCTITNNSSGSHGGGIMALIGTNKLVMKNCTISGNAANRSSAPANGVVGGGVYVEGNSILTNCLFQNNSAQSCAADYRGSSTAAGGGLYLTLSSSLQDCSISGNAVHA